MTWDLKGDDGLKMLKIKEKGSQLAKTRRKEN